MKRIFQTLLLLLAVVPAANAELPFLPGFTGRVGSGDAYYIRAGYSRTANEVGNWYAKSHNGYAYVGMMGRYYRDYSDVVFSSGTFTLDGGYNWQGRWGLGLNLALTPVTSRIKNSITGEGVRSDRSTVFSILPEARYYYLYNDALRLYSSVGVGRSFLKGFGSMKGVWLLQLNLAGAEFGDRVFCFAEFGFGDIFDYFRGGVGFRF